FLTVAMSLSVGTTVGMVAGYYGGWIDDVLMRFVDMVLAIPAIFLFILMSILFRPNALTLAAIVASVGWGSVARLVRGEVLEVQDLHTVFSTKEGTVKAVDGVSFGLTPGETLGIVGESGCGKSVTALSVMRLQRPGKIVSGKVMFKGQDLTKLSEYEMREIR